MSSAASATSRWRTGGSCSPGSASTRRFPTSTTIPATMHCWPAPAAGSSAPPTTSPLHPCRPRPDATWPWPAAWWSAAPTVGPTAGRSWPLGPLSAPAGGSGSDPHADLFNRGQQLGSQPARGRGQPRRLPAPQLRLPLPRVGAGPQGEGVERKASSASSFVQSSAATQFLLHTSVNGSIPARAQCSRAKGGSGSADQLLWRQNPCCGFLFLNAP